MWDHAVEQRCAWEMVVRTASPAWRLNGGRGGTEGAPHGKSPSQREDGQEKISPFFRNGLDFANLFQWVSTVTQINHDCPIKQMRIRHGSHSSLGSRAWGSRLRGLVFICHVLQNMWRSWCDEGRCHKDVSGGAPSSQWPSCTEGAYSWSLVVNNARKMCTVANTTVSLGRPLCPAHLAQHLFPSVLYSPCPTISAESSHIHMHSHTYTHMHACTHPACLSVSYISLPINATSAEHSYRLSHIVTHAHAPTTHTHTNAHTYSYTHAHTCVLHSWSFGSPLDLLWISQVVQL